MHRRHWIGLVACAGMAAILGGCGLTRRARFTREVEQVVPLDTAGLGLDVLTHNGSITVVEDPSRGDVLIEATIHAVSRERADSVTILASTPDGRWMMVRAAWPQPGRESNEGVTLRITAPRLDGLRLVTSNGGVDVAGHAGGAWVNTSNGGITITGHQGEIDAETSNGGVEIAGATGRVEVRSSNGRVDVALGDSSTGPVAIRTSNGNARLRVGPAFAGVIEGRTSNGRVAATLGPGRGSVDRAADDHVTARVGDGAEKSSVDTSNGSIEIVAD